MEPKLSEIIVGNNKFKLDEDDIINVTTIGEFDAQTAIAMKNAFYQIIDMIEGRCDIIVDANRGAKPTPEARKIFKEMTEHKQIGKVAIIGMNPVVKMMATFVIGISEKKNMKIFKTREEAIAWLKA